MDRRTFAQAIATGITAVLGYREIPELSFAGPGWDEEILDLNAFRIALLDARGDPVLEAKALQNCIASYRMIGDWEECRIDADDLSWTVEGKNVEVHGIALQIPGMHDVILPYEGTIQITDGNTFTLAWGFEGIATITKS